jgi:hypothetical protein
MRGCQSSFIAGDHLTLWAIIYKAKAAAKSYK